MKIIKCSKGFFGQLILTENGNCWNKVFKITILRLYGLYLFSTLKKFFQKSYSKCFVILLAVLAKQIFSQFSSIIRYAEWVLWFLRISCGFFFWWARAIWSRPTNVHIFAKFLPHPVFHYSSQRPQKVKNHKCTPQWQRCSVPLRTEWSRSRNLADDLCRALCVH